MFRLVDPAIITNILSAQTGSSDLWIHASNKKHQYIYLET